MIQPSTDIVKLMEALLKVISSELQLHAYSILRLLIYCNYLIRSSVIS